MPTMRSRDALKDLLNTPHFCDWLSHKVPLPAGGGGAASLAPNRGRGKTAITITAETDGWTMIRRTRVEEIRGTRLTDIVLFFNGRRPLTVNAVSNARRQSSSYPEWLGFWNG